ncbi:MAG: HAD-IA family hydrolase [Actinomycetota bacterium]
MSGIRTITTVLLDLDGVIRHFDGDHLGIVERDHELPSGSISEVAFESTLIDQVITGRLTKAEWRDVVGERLGRPAAAAAWMADPGTVDDELLAEVDGLRASGITVAILTNGTDTIAEEAAALGFDHRVDAIFSTADIGYAKPDRRAFEHVCRELGVEPRSVFFTDDSETKLDGAIEIGMTAHRYEGVALFRQHLGELGVGRR